MMTIDEMNQIKEELGITYQQLCRESGVPIGTLQKVLGGFTKNPRVSTMSAIENALYSMKLNREKATGTYRPGKYGTTVVREGVNSFAPFSYGSSAEKLPEDTSSKRLERYRKHTLLRSVDDGHIYTATERESFPDDMRTEIIDGVLYDMATPTMYHQQIVAYIFKNIDDCIVKHGMPCHAFIAPADVAIDRDEYTVVQPDVFVVCDETQITDKVIMGPPSFILEVLSKSTRKKDLIEKLAKYVETGVDEYWAIDPKNRMVMVYDMRDQEYAEAGSDPDSDDDRTGYTVTSYSFNDRIPVLISEGKCVIDMAPLKKELDRLYKDW